ncbi:UNVERIFIED_CONTAM: hypothetical protein FKN15_004527 [Acipenser sinensis]
MQSVPSLWFVLLNLKGPVRDPVIIRIIRQVGSGNGSNRDRGNLPGEIVASAWSARRKQRVGYGLAEVNAIIIKALWRGEEKTQRIEQNLRWREKEQEEEVYEEAQSGEIDLTMLTDSQTGSKREGQPGSRAPPPANVMLEPGIPLLSTPQRFTIMGERNLPRRPIKSDL